MRCKHLCLALLIGLPLLLVNSNTYAEINIGVLAPRGKLNALKQWKDFSAYLQNELQQPVNIIPLPPPDVLAALQSGELDYALTNPVHAVTAVKIHNARLLASLNKASGAEFAGVIVARKGSGIKTARDLLDKRVMSLKFKDAAGAYVFQTYHLHQRGIDPHKDFASMREGKKQDDLILAVKAGVIDAAFVRTGILESMEKEGKISIDEFEIVDQHGPDDMKQLHSTAHYPEWYLLDLNRARPVVTTQLLNAALALSADHPAARTAKIKGFVKPVSMDGMVTALKTLKIAPYNETGGVACR